MEIRLEPKKRERNHQTIAEIPNVMDVSGAGGQRVSKFLGPRGEKTMR